MSTLTTHDKVEKRIQGIQALFLDSTHPAYSQALDILNTYSWPSKKEEDWKYISPDELWIEGLKTPQNQSSLTAIPEVPFQANILVFLDGYFQAHKSQILDDQLSVNSSHSSTLALDSVFNAAHTLYAQDGIEISVAKNSTLKHPVYIHHIGSQTQSMAWSRHKIKIHAGAQATIFLSHYSSSERASIFEYLTQEIEVDENAQLHWICLQNQNQISNHLQQTHVALQKNSRWISHYISLGGHITRNNLKICLNGSGIDAHLYGISKISGQQKVDHHTYIAHNEPHCESTEMYKHIVSDKALSVFNGKIYVKHDAQKTNAFQSSQNLLLSDGARAYSKPELEIYADDVKCSHGSTTGQLNEEARFYLKARGIGEEKATQLLLGAFIEEVVEKIENTDIKKHIQKILTL